MSRETNNPSQSSRKTLSVLELDDAHETEETTLTTFQREEYLLEMENYEKKMDFIQNVLEEIQTFTDFYFLSIADQMTPQDVDNFLSVIQYV
jgi:hypothetical protein